MRWLFLLLCLTNFPFPVRAQEQERKLADRLLRPDLTLVNAAQDKKFTGTGSTPVERKFVVKSFHTGNECVVRNFSSGKDFPAKKFAAREFTGAEQTTNSQANAVVASAHAEFGTRKSSFAQIVSDESRMAKTRDYADSRPFLAQGTRQKILSQKDKPLTIDEVRELLNKNK